MTIAPWRTAGPRRRSAGRPVADSTDLLTVAEGLARSASAWPGMDDPSERCWRTIAVTEKFEAWVIAWPVGGSVELHDHGDSAGVVVVASGTLVETSIRADSDGRLGTVTEPVDAGQHVIFAPGHVHDMVNEGPGPALSIHIYSPALRTMNFFETGHLHGLVPVRTEEYREGLLVL
jgi:mannose-6-phosphate isomerase-like protein (cupin superfamily)